MADNQNITLGQLKNFAEKADQRLDKLELSKQNINPLVSFTIPTTGWGTDTSIPSYPKYLDIAVPGMLETDVVAVDVAPGSCDVARAADFASTRTYAGKFRLRAKNVPTAAITAQYRIINTAAYTAAYTAQE